MIRKGKILNKKTIASFNEDLSKAKRFKNVDEMFKQKKKTQKEILIENADDVIEMIRQAKSYEDIQEKFAVHAKYVAEFITSSEYSVRAREAQKESAETISRKAELSLLQIQADDTQASVTRQRELAHHYRWLAAKKNPHKFGDSTKVQAEVKDTSASSTWLGEVLSEIDKNK
jgi:hypothetical protein